MPSQHSPDTAQHYFATSAEPPPRSGVDARVRRCRFADALAENPSIYADPGGTWRSSAKAEMELGGGTMKPGCCVRRATL